MNILIDLLPTSFEIDGVEYEINSDFRTSILFEMLMQDDDLPDEDKIISALELYYPVLPTDINKAVDKILYFYRCGKDVSKSKRAGNSNGVKQIYSFEHDDDYIYSAYLDQYGIDLQDVEYLHWWKFKAMYKALKEDNEIVKIMGYRAMDLNKITDKEQKQFYKNMQKIHGIPKNNSDIEKINVIEEALINGKDISNIL
ncbi:bacteriophage Gp15 family protein [Clostridium gasigenes]|uniref:bacteriophage Gp15 family protein n=1 Tax=Clostridium gasigenes TaxID=94869 RepID=UPI001C0DFB70|nr:bacteriophage Gp15 family protein [Clostridium gasigenes]MBU3107138.1 bacteriophage Gp15 family protein [Clostridium gasigenes]